MSPGTDPNADPAVVYPHVRGRLHAWATTCANATSKVLMGGRSLYGTSLGFGTRAPVSKSPPTIQIDWGISPLEISALGFHAGLPLRISAPHSRSRFPLWAPAGWGAKDYLLPVELRATFFGIKRFG